MRHEEYMMEVSYSVNGNEKETVAGLLISKSGKKTGFGAFCFQHH